jgi:hypothetical protein
MLRADAPHRRQGALKELEVCSRVATLSDCISSPIQVNQRLFPLVDSLVQLKDDLQREILSESQRTEKEKAVENITVFLKNVLKV